MLKDTWNSIFEEEEELRDLANEYYRDFNRAFTDARDAFIEGFLAGYQERAEQG